MLKFKIVGILVLNFLALLSKTVFTASVAIILTILVLAL